MYRVLKRSAILCGCIVRSPFLSVPTLHTHNEEHLIGEKRIQAFFQTYIKQSHESPTSRQSYHTKTEAYFHEPRKQRKYKIPSNMHSKQPSDDEKVFHTEPNPHE